MAGRGPIPPPPPGPPRSSAPGEAPFRGPSGWLRRSEWKAKPRCGGQPRRDGAAGPLPAPRAPRPRGVRREGGRGLRGLQVLGGSGSTRPAAAGTPARRRSRTSGGPGRRPAREAGGRGAARSGDGPAGLPPLARSPAAGDHCVPGTGRCIPSRLIAPPLCSPSPPFPFFLLTFHTTLPCLSLEQLPAVS